jgi:hypothetical protein
MATFTNNSLNVTLPEPDLLLTELSTDVDFISAGTVNGKNVLGIAFNELSTIVGAPTALAGNMVTLSASNGVKFAIDEAYNGQEMGVILEDRTVCLFTAATATGQTGPQTLGAASDSNSYAELRRLKALGYI